MVKGLLESPTRSCLKMIFPLEVALTAIAVISMTGEKNMIRNVEPTISISLFRNLFKVFSRGTLRILKSGMPSKLEIYILDDKLENIFGRMENLMPQFSHMAIRWSREGCNWSESMITASSGGEFL